MTKDELVATIRLLGFSPEYSPVPVSLHVWQVQLSWRNSESKITGWFTHRPQGRCELDVFFYNGPVSRRVLIRGKTKAIIKTIVELLEEVAAPHIVQKSLDIC